VLDNQPKPTKKEPGLSQPEKAHRGVLPLHPGVYLGWQDHRRLPRLWAPAINSRTFHQGAWANQIPVAL
jgi:hypothetical protein